MADLRTERRVPAERLTAYCDPATLPFHCTDDLHPIEAIFGQERAVRAIEFALGMSASGYNLYAAGPDGLGKETIVEGFLRRRAAQMEPPLEWVYVHNFADADRPNAISFPPGEAREFSDAVAHAVQQATTELRETFDSDSYARQRQELGRVLETQRAELITALQQQAEQIGFAIQMTPQGIISAPLEGGKPLNDEAFAALPEQRRTEIQHAAEQLDQVVQEAMLRMRALERETQQQVEHLDEQVAAFAVEHHFQPLNERWGDDREVEQFLEGVRSDLAHEHELFRAQPAAPLPVLPGMPNPTQQNAALFHRYEVNVLVSRGTQTGAPVVFERNPTYFNLIGRMEFAGQFGAIVTDHTMIRPGSLLLANGGFLILRVRDLLTPTNAAAFQAMKRALAQHAVAIENPNEFLGIVPASGMRPEPIPLDVKVVLIGDGATHSALFRYDPDFRELFRVKADFDTDFERTQDNILGLASIIRAQATQNGLHCFTAGAVARLVEQSSRNVEDQRRLSANMGSFADVIRQADYWANQDSAKEVEAKHVERALDELEYRSALVRDRLQLMIDDGSLFIATTGAVTGQINALSVFDLGDMEFGRPTRITCVTSAGSGTIVNVERETEMAGSIHNKGFLILRGFLSDRFGQDRAMALSASLTFEQLYGQIDGDSASSTELYALLSSLADVPISQSLAVTGSVNQHGEVQPIGGAIYKIEGFYEVCRARGLDGTQGVMLPQTNVPNVVLRPDVAQAIADGKFHVWAVETIEQGIELLTGIPAGVRGADGKYPEGTIFRRVEDRLDAFADALEQRGRGVPADLPHAVPSAMPPSAPPGVPPQPPPPPPIKV